MDPTALQTFAGKAKEIIQEFQHKFSEPCMILHCFRIWAGCSKVGWGVCRGAGVCTNWQQNFTVKQSCQARSFSDAFKLRRTVMALQITFATGQGYEGVLSSTGSPKRSTRESKQRCICFQTALRGGERLRQCSSYHRGCRFWVWCWLLWKPVMPICSKPIAVQNLAIPGVSHEKLSSSTCTSGGGNYVYLDASLLAFRCCASWNVVERWTSECKSGWVSFIIGSVHTMKVLSHFSGL